MLSSSTQKYPGFFNYAHFWTKFSSCLILYFFRQSVNYPDSRPSTYLPQLRKDFEFVKNCLRDKDLWCKLSDEEKNYCRATKEKMKKEIIGKNPKNPKKFSNFY